MKVRHHDQVREVRVERDALVLDGERLPFRILDDGAGGTLLEVEGCRHRIRSARQADRVFVWCDGDVFEFHLARRAARGGAEDGDLLAPMPGRIRQSLVAEGESVHRGQVLLILEAMKMEHAIRAPRDGTVSRLPHRAGDLVDTGTPLVVLA